MSLSPVGDLIETIQKLVDVEFSKPDRLYEAFTAAGAVDRDGNKNLALVGDTALQLFLQTEGRIRNANRGMKS